MPVDFLEKQAKEQTARIIAAAKKEAQRLTDEGKRFGGAITKNMEAIRLLLKAMDPLVKEYKKFIDFAITYSAKCDKIGAGIKEADEAGCAKALKAVEKLEPDVRAAEKSLEKVTSTYFTVEDKILKLVKKTRLIIKAQLKSSGGPCPFCNGKGSLKALTDNQKGPLVAFLTELDNIEKQTRAAWE